MAALAACFALGAALPALATPQPTRTAVNADAPMVVRLELASGKCGEGLCRRKYVINQAGLLRITDQEGKTVDKLIAREDLAALVEQINNADYKTLYANRTEGSCPSDSGGEDHTYTFYTARGSRMISNCAIKIDPTAQPFARFQEILGKYQPQ
jgi:uncharacterized low-complexity protein